MLVLEGFILLCWFVSKEWLELVDVVVLKSAIPFT